MSRVPFIEQMEHSECGMACLAMILAYNKHFISLTELRNQFDPPRDGMSFFHLIKIANNLGFEGNAYQVAEYGIEQINSKNFPVPFIAHWDKGRHFVVVEKIYKYGVKIIDPAFGEMRISKKEFQENFTGALLVLSPGPKFRTRRKQSKLNFFIPFLIEHKKWLIGVFFVSILLIALGLVIPLSIKWITDSITLSKNTLNLKSLSSSILIIFVSYLIFSVFRGLLIAKLQKYLDQSIMTKFISHLFGLPYKFFEQRTSGDLLFRANSHTLIRQLLSMDLIGFVIDMILVITYALIMLYLSLRLGVIIILISLMILIILVISTPITLRLTGRYVLTQSKVQSTVAENLNAVMDIKIMGLEKKVVNQWEKKFKEHLDVVEKSNIWTTLLDSISTGIQFIMPLFILWLGGSLILQNKMTLGSLLAFSSLSSMFIAPFLSIGGSYMKLIQIRPILQRLFDVFDSHSEQNNQLIEKHKDISGKIELKNVFYRYDSFGDDILSNINLKIEPGEIIGIVGPSGSGKSTLVKLLIGLYQLKDGDILFDDKPIESYNLQTLRKQMGIVLQETQLFNNTIIENITKEDDYYSLDDVLWAAKSAAIHEDIIKLPMNYNSMLSETGVNLSGGQRQRLLLARALYNKPRILILDEATSSLDKINEHLIEKNLSGFDCTRIIIAHRLNTIKNANKIIVLDEGEIVELGNHYQLMEKRGVYYNLYKTESCSP